MVLPSTSEPPPLPPTKAKLFLPSKIPFLPHPKPRTSENKEEMLLAQPGLDRAGLRLKVLTGRYCSVGLAPPLLKWESPGGTHFLGVP